MRPASYAALTKLAPSLSYIAMKTPTAHAAPPPAIAAIASLALVDESRICIVTVMLYRAASASNASIVPEKSVLLSLIHI